MDAKRNSQKRKTLSSPFPSHPQSGVSTRSRAQHFIHHNLSAEPLSLDDNDDKLVLTDLLKKSKLSEKPSIAGGDEHSHVLIKDLRTRRVYSPQSDTVSSSKTIPRVYLEESAVESSFRDQKITGSGFVSSLFVENNEDSKGNGENDKLGEVLAKDVINSVLSSIVNEYQSDKEEGTCCTDAVGAKIEQTEVPEVGFSCIGRNLDHMKSESLVTSSKLQDTKPVCGNVSEKIDDLTEQSVQTTPPDFDICGNLGVIEDEGNHVEGFYQNIIHHDKDVDLIACGQEESGDMFCAKVDKRNEYVLTRKSVLRSRLQRKLFKTPGSVSYRRLLPFLVNMTKDDSGTPELGDCKIDDKGMDAKSSNTSSITYEHHSSKEKGYALDYDDIKQPIIPRKSIFVSTCLSEAQNLNHILSEPVDNETGSIANNQNDDAEVLNHVHDSSKETAKPSDTMIFEKSDLAENGGNKAETIMKTAVSDLRMPSNGSNDRNVSGIGKMKNLSESNTKLVLNPCSRIKLVKYPGSFSYRRMLPFLENTTKNNSCVSVNDNQPILKRNLDQTPLRPISPSNLQVSYVNNSKGCVFSPAISGSQQKAGLPGIVDLLNGNSPDKRSFAPLNESQSSSDSYKVIQLQGERHISNEDSTLGSVKISAPKLDSSMSSLHCMSNEISSRQDAASTSCHSSVYSEVKGNSSLLISSNGEMPLEINGSYQKLSQLSAIEQLSDPTVGAKKGILKRNPRGCKGLCTCLNCASFRLHAERAFEFSKNQLLDAKEVTLDLIKELSYLRNILQRCTDSTNNHSVLKVDQVKEACTKAFAAEQNAKDRLTLMNDDLNIHCRITCWQPPKVTFSNHVEEKVIPRS